MKKIFYLIFRNITLFLVLSAYMLIVSCNSGSTSPSAEERGSYDFVHSNSEIAYSHNSSGLHIISLSDTILSAVPQDDLGEGKMISAEDFYSSGWDADAPGPFLAAPPRGVLTYTNPSGANQTVNVTVNNVIAMSNHVGYAITLNTLITLPMWSDLPTSVVNDDGTLSYPEGLELTDGKPTHDQIQSYVDAANVDAYVMKNVTLTIDGGNFIDVGSIPSVISAPRKQASADATCTYWLQLGLEVPLDAAFIALTVGSDGSVEALIAMLVKQAQNAATKHALFTAIGDVMVDLGVDASTVSTIKQWLGLYIGIVMASLSGNPSGVIAHILAYEACGGSWVPGD